MTFSHLLKIDNVYPWNFDILFFFITEQVINSIT